MSTPDIATAMTCLEPDRIETLLAKLQKTRTWKHYVLLSIMPVVLSILYGYIVWRRGEQFFELFLFVLVLINAFHGSYTGHSDKQLRLVVEMVEELHKAGKISTAERKMYATSPTRRNLL